MKEKDRVMVEDFREALHRPGILATYIERARPILIEVAKQRKTITYGNLMNRLGWHGRRYIGHVVGRISEMEYENRRLRLSAVVVRADTGMVGGGFLGLPKTPENVRRSTPEEWQKPKLSAAEEKYWRAELERVYDYWCDKGISKGCQGEA